MTCSRSQRSDCSPLLFLSLPFSTECVMTIRLSYGWRTCLRHNNSELREIRTCYRPVQDECSNHYTPCSSEAFGGMKINLRRSIQSRDVMFQIDWWEGLITLMLFVAFIIMSYTIDRKNEACALGFRYVGIYDPEDDSSSTQKVTPSADQTVSLNTVFIYLP